MIEVASHQRKALGEALMNAHGRVIISKIDGTAGGTWIQVDIPEDEYTINIDPHGKVSSD